MAAPTLAPRRAPAPAPARGPVHRRHGTLTWWLSPVTVISLVIPISVAATFYVGPAVFAREYRMSKLVTPEVLVLFLAGGLAMALGAAVVAALRPPTRRGPRWPVLGAFDVPFLQRVSTVLFGLTLVGYAGFVVAGVLRGVTIGQVIGTEETDPVYVLGLEDQLGTIPGVTTLTQVGMASVVVSGLLLTHGGSRRELVRIAVLMGLAVLRAVLLTERLAVLELAIPLVVVLAARASSGGGRGRRRVALIPVVAAPLLVVVFGVFEYSRSWVFYRQFGGSFPQFVVERLAGYYVTAYNNGYLQMTYGSRPGHWPSGIANAVWNAPGLDNLELLRLVNGYDQGVLTRAVLAQYGNPEFNNLSGVGIVFSDLGLVGGFVYLFGAGLVVGLMYTAFCESRLWGLLLYPTIFIALLEIPRVLYWAEGRSLPTYVAIAVVLLMYRRSVRRIQASARSPM